MAEKKPTFDATIVKSLAEILNDTDLTEIEIEQGDMRVRVSREPAPQYFNQVASSAPAAPAAAAPAMAPAPSAAPVTPAKNSSSVPSPMVGTVYFSPAPGEPAFVKVGDKVKEGQTLLIIEAMKVMNQIPAPRAGTVVSINVEDGDPVEYGQSLLAIE